MAVARTMLTRSPFRRWPLHVRVFTREAWEIWGGFKVVGQDEGEEEEAVTLTQEHEKDKVKGKGKGKAVSAKVKPKKPPGKRKTLAEKRTYDPLPEVATVVLDLGGVDGQAPGRLEGVKGVTKIDGPIDVEDTEFRGMVWDKWKAFREGAEGSGGECAVCKGVIEDVDVSRTFGFRKGSIEMSCRGLTCWFSFLGSSERCILRLVRRLRCGKIDGQVLLYRPPPMLSKTLPSEPWFRGICYRQPCEPDLAPYRPLPPV
jgi:hypothetical protein